MKKLWKFQRRGEPDSILNKSGYNYLLSYTPQDAFLATQTDADDITLCGTETQDVPDIAEVIYNVKKDEVSIVLKKQYGYDISYNVTIGDDTFLCTTVEEKKIEPETVVIKSVDVSDEGTLATVYICNATYKELSKNLVGTDSDGKTITYSVLLPAESIYEFPIDGTDLDLYTWTLMD